MGRGHVAWSDVLETRTFVFLSPSSASLQTCHPSPALCRASVSLINDWLGGTTDEQNTPTMPLPGDIHAISRSHQPIASCAGFIAWVPIQAQYKASSFAPSQCWYRESASRDSSSLETGDLERIGCSCRGEPSSRSRVRGLARVRDLGRGDVSCLNWIIRKLAVRFHSIAPPRSPVSHDSMSSGAGPRENVCT